MVFLHAVIRGVYQWLVWGNVFMALSAAGWVVVAWKHLALPPDPVLALLAFALAIVFYTRDRLDPQEQHADHWAFVERVEWVKRFRIPLYLWVGGALMVALYCIYLRPLSLYPLLAGVGFALSYTWRWIPWRGERWSWKQVPGFKTIFVALLWVILTVMTPVTVYNGWGDPLRIFQVAGSVAVLVFCQILLNDVRDEEGDQRNKVYSIPVLLGEYWARMIGLEVLVFPGAVGLALWQPAIPIVTIYTGILLVYYRRNLDGFWRPFIELQGAVAGLISLL